LFCLLISGLSPVRAADKQASVFYPRGLRELARVNATRSPGETQVQQLVVRHAQPWLKLSEEALWGLMFGPTIERSWMVWSDGHCPACKKPVPMYEWKMDAMARPWKTWCPHCAQEFPKNDFAAFYRSGLDAQGVFDPQRADRSLVFNAEHPDAADPLHRFGVDDGSGFAEGDKRWRFIGAYLVYGQWKEAVLGGIKALAQAYVVTGDRRYAFRAGILLDRVADLYPTFDFHAQALLYERVRGHGYVSVWHDACEETRELALAYDQVFEGMREDGELVRFLSGQARRYGLKNPKSSFADIRRNIEDRILRDALAHRPKISSNYPRTDIAVAVMKAILEWPANRDEVYGLVDAMIERTTAVDGVTGEKGLANYSAFGVQSLALFLAEWDRADRGFLKRCLNVHPRLRQTYRFHIDTWCLQKYYPLSGDSGWFAAKIDQYQGVRFQTPGTAPRYSHQDAPLSPSMFTFMWDLSRLTGDVTFVQALYRANGDSVQNLPHDVFAEDTGAIRKGVADIIAQHGAEPKVGSVNKQQWRLAILRSQSGAHARAVWLDYDSGGGHGHQDGLNLGLFALGLDLLPDFGYPPVNYGGWGSPRAVWYRKAAAHNTVVVDGRDQGTAGGTTTLWADGAQFRAVRVSAPAMIGGRQYERTVVSVDVSSRDFYVVDVFRVVGGRDHAKFLHSHFGRLTTEGLALQACEDYGHGTQMRAFRRDPAPRPGWWADWQIEDRYGLLSKGAPPVHLRYTDLTAGVQACIAEAWVAVGGYSSTQEAWIPRLMIRRQADQAPLASNFVGVLQPYAEPAAVAKVRRLGLKTLTGDTCSDADVALEVTLPGGVRDLVIAADVENPLARTPHADGRKAIVQDDWKVQFVGELCLVRRDPLGRVTRLALCRAQSMAIDNLHVKVAEKRDFVELALRDGVPQVITGDAKDIVEVCPRNASAPSPP
jgi:hypothetical protein